MPTEYYAHQPPNLIIKAPFPKTFIKIKVNFKPLDLIYIWYSSQNKILKPIKLYTYGTIFDGRSCGVSGKPYCWGAIDKMHMDKMPADKMPTDKNVYWTKCLLDKMTSGQNAYIT